MTFGKQITLLISDQHPSNCPEQDCERLFQKARRESGRRRGGTGTGKDIGQDREHKDVLLKGDEERQTSPALYIKVN